MSVATIMEEAKTMTRLIALALVALSCTARAAYASQPIVAEKFGNIEWSDARGFTKTLSSDHHSGSPVLSPDGRTVAWIHIDKLKPKEPDEAGITSVWVADGLTGTARKFAGSDIDADLRSEIINPQSLAFSLDGGFLYVTSQLGAVTPGIHQVSVSTGMRRFVVPGALTSVIRTAPYRGYLIVGQHRYYAQGGSYDASYLFRPDGKEIFMVPGSKDIDDPDSVKKWLNNKNWQAW